MADMTQGEILHAAIRCIGGLQDDVERLEAKLVALDAKANAPRDPAVDADALAEKLADRLGPAMQSAIRRAAIRKGVR